MENRENIINLMRHAFFMGFNEGYASGKGAGIYIRDCKYTGKPFEAKVFNSYYDFNSEERDADLLSLLVDFEDKGFMCYGTSCGCGEGCPEND
jgi:hypothetical protein